MPNIASIVKPTLMYHEETHFYFYRDSNGFVTTGTGFEWRQYLNVIGQAPKLTFQFTQDKVIKKSGIILELTDLNAQDAEILNKKNPGQYLIFKKGDSVPDEIVALQVNIVQLLDRGLSATAYEHSNFMRTNETDATRYFDWFIENQMYGVFPEWVKRIFDTAPTAAQICLIDIAWQEGPKGVYAKIPDRGKCIKTRDWVGYAETLKSDEKYAARNDDRKDLLKDAELEDIQKYSGLLAKQFKEFSKFPAPVQEGLVIIAKSYSTMADFVKACPKLVDAVNDQDWQEASKLAVNSALLAKTQAYAQTLIARGPKKADEKKLGKEDTDQTTAEQKKAKEEDAVAGVRTFFKEFGQFCTEAQQAIDSLAVGTLYSNIVPIKKTTAETVVEVKKVFNSHFPSFIKAANKKDWTVALAQAKDQTMEKDPYVKPYFNKARTLMKKAADEQLELEKKKATGKKAELATELRQDIDLFGYLPDGAQEALVLLRHSAGSMAAFRESYGALTFAVNDRNWAAMPGAVESDAVPDYVMDYARSLFEVEARRMAVELAQREQKLLRRYPALRKRHPKLQEVVWECYNYFGFEGLNRLDGRFHWGVIGPDPKPLIAVIEELVATQRTA